MMCQFIKRYRQIGVTETDRVIYQDSAGYSQSPQTYRRQISIAIYFRFTSKYFRNVNNLLLLH